MRSHINVQGNLDYTWYVKCGWEEPVGSYNGVFQNRFFWPKCDEYWALLGNWTQNRDCHPQWTSVKRSIMQKAYIVSLVIGNSAQSGNTYHRNKSSHF